MKKFIRILVGVASLAAVIGWTVLIMGVKDWRAPMAGAGDGSTNDMAPWNHFYYQNLGGGTQNFDIVTSLLNRYQIMAYAAESRSTALGATLGVGNVVQNISLSRTTLPRIWISDPSGHGFSDHFWHSAEFRGAYWLQQGYWSSLLNNEAFNLK